MARQTQRENENARDRCGLAAAVFVGALGLTILAPANVARAEIQLFWSTTGISNANFVYSTAQTNFLPYFVPPTPVTWLPEGTYDLFLWGRFIENWDPYDPNFLPSYVQVYLLDLRSEGSATIAQNAAYRHNKTGAGSYRRWDSGAWIPLDGIMAAVTARGIEFIPPPDDNNDLYDPNTQEFLIGAARFTGAGGQTAVFALDPDLGIAVREIEWEDIPDPIVVPAVLTFGSETAAACCFLDGHCEMISEPQCANAGGSYLGEGTDCDPNPCSPPGGPGDNCADPRLVYLPAELPYANSNTTCSASTTITRRA